MAIKYSFVDGGTYGTEDINDITRCLTGAGVSPFVSKESYNLSDLNVLLEAGVEPGTALGGCKVSVLDASMGRMKIVVSEGIIFFESGVRLEVDEEGFEIEAKLNDIGYVLAQYSPALQKAEILFCENLPENGEYVVLATILAEGKVKDERKFARSKVATMGTNVALGIDAGRITVYETYKAAPTYSGQEKILAEIDLSGIDISKFNYLIYQYDYSGPGSTVPDYCEKYFDIKSGESASFHVKKSLYYSIKFEIVPSGSKLLIVVGSDTGFSSFKAAFKSAIPYFKLV